MKLDEIRWNDIKIGICLKQDPRYSINNLGILINNYIKKLKIRYFYSKSEY